MEPLAYKPGHAKPSFTAAPQGILGGTLIAGALFVLHLFRIVPSAAVIVAGSVVAVAATLAWAVRESRRRPATPHWQPNE
jgi:hypothetical protein